MLDGKKNNLSLCWELNFYYHANSVKRNRIVLPITRVKIKNDLLVFHDILNFGEVKCVDNLPTTIHLPHQTNNGKPGKCSQL